MSAAPSPVGTGPFANEIRLIFIAALVLFSYTVAIGILNGLDLIEFERGPLLAHLHVGTLGWITLAVFAAALTLFGDEQSAGRAWLRYTALSAPLVAAAYNVAFATTTGVARPIMGTLMTAVIVLMAAWGFSQARGRPLSVPHLGVLAGLATSVVGALLGILLGLRYSHPDLGITETLEGAHPATMVVGFLIPVGMAFAEWVLNPSSTAVRAGRLGQLQIGLPFLGGVAVAAGILLDALPLIMVSLPLEVAGLGIFMWRMLPMLRTTSWLAPGVARHGAAASVFLVVNISIFVYLLSNYADDMEAAPRRLLLALDHSIFVGVLTIAILGHVARLSSASRPSVVDHLVFGGATVGVALFVGGLLADMDGLIRAGTPLLGTALLLAIVVHVFGLLGTGTGTGRRAEG